MSLERLRATLVELEMELAQVDQLDPAARSQLQAAASEIAAALRRNDGPDSDLKLEPPHTVREQLLENVESFRVQHPTLAGILQRLVDGLGQIGI